MFNQTLTPLRQHVDVVDQTERQVMVVEKNDVSADVVALTLRSCTGRPLPNWRPGAHIELLLNSGGTQIRRHYSLCGDVSSRDWRIAVLREPNGRGGSAFIHDVVDAGDIITVLGPRNHFTLKPSAKYLFIAGGIGITPILPMVYQVMTEKKPWHLIYCARTRDRVVFADEISALPAEQVTTHIDEEGGLLDFTRTLAPLLSDTAVFVCGPRGLLRAIEDEATSAPWPFYSEQFLADAAVPSQPTDQPFEVEIQSTTQRFTIRPGKSILDVLNDNGFEVPASCRQGVCGTCETKVVEGTPDHRDTVLTRAERAQNDRMMVCVSRARCRRLILGL